MWTSLGITRCGWWGAWAARLASTNVLLFCAGYLWARRKRYNRVSAGLLLAAIGARLILLAFVFGAI